MRLALALAALAVIAAACGSDSTGPGNPDPCGAYISDAIEAHGLPIARDTTRGNDGSTKVTLTWETHTQSWVWYGPGSDCWESPYEPRR